MKFQCVRCGKCCKGSDKIVLLSGHDIVDIVRGLYSISSLMRINECMIFHKAIDKELTGELDDILINTEEGLCYLALKKQENGDCIFLKDNECMIYDWRPTICRAYPYNMKIRKYVTDCIVDFDCSGVGLGEDDDSIPLKLENLAVKASNEIETYKEFVDEWNRTQDEPLALNFLVKMLSNSRFYQ